MADDKELERQYRKNLMVVASLVLIYSIAGGQMASGLSMFGAKLNFSRPEWLEYTMVFVMCFFWWRHWQVSKSIREDVILDACNGFEVPSFMYGKIKRDVCQKLNLNENEFASIWEYDGVRVRHHESHYENDGYLIKVSRVGFISVTLSYLSEISIQYKLDRAWLVCGLLYRKAWIQNAIRDPKFGDAILPSILTITALVSYFSHIVF